MGYVLQSMQENGQTKDVFVYKMDDDTQLPLTEAQKLQDQLMKESLKMALEGVISACQEIGGTDGKGGGSSGGYSDYDLNSKQTASQAAANAAQKIVEVSDKAVEQAAQQARLTQKPVESVSETLVNLVKDLKAAETEHADNYVKLKELTSQNSSDVNSQAQVDQLQKAMDNLASSKEKIDGIKSQIDIHTHVYKLALNNHIQATNQYLQSKEDLTQAQQKVEALTGSDTNLKSDGNNKLENLSGGTLAPAPSSDPQDYHKYLKDHNVFYDLLMVAMKGNSSIFGIISEALGKISNLLSGNQEVTSIITKLNDDLKALISGGKPGAQPTGQEVVLMQDIESQLQLLKNYINPNRPDFYTPPGETTAQAKAEAQQAHDSMGDTLCGQMQTLVDSYNSEFTAALTAAKLKIPKGDDPFQAFLSDTYTYMPAFTNFYNDMVNASGDKNPSATATAVYSNTSNAVTSLNTAGSQFMAEQNLYTKQIDQVEKIWTNGFSTMTSAMNSVVNNIAG